MTESSLTACRALRAVHQLGNCKQNLMMVSRPSVPHLQFCKTSPHRVMRFCHTAPTLCDEVLQNRIELCDEVLQNCTTKCYLSVMLVQSVVTPGLFAKHNKLQNDHLIKLRLRFLLLTATEHVIKSFNLIKSEDKPPMESVNDDYH